MAANPKKSSITPAQSIEYQPGTSPEGQHDEPANAQEGNARRDVETDTESKEDPV